MKSRRRCFKATAQLPAPWIEVLTSIQGDRVVRLVERLGKVHGFPERIARGNVPEFLSLGLRTWAEERDIDLDYIDPGKPVQFGFAESFNGTLRGERLNEHKFMSLRAVRRKTGLWRRRYNEERPRSSLGGLTPREFAAGRG